MSSISCCCGRTFSTSAAFKNHSRGCIKNKKHLASVLTKAQELYNTKRHHPSTNQDTSQSGVSFQDPGSASIQGTGVQLRNASIIENFDAEARMPSKML